MPADTRTFIASICVRYDTKSTRIELARAEDHGGPAGTWRARVGRRWLDLPEGGRRYLDTAQLAALVVDTLGGAPELPPVPDLPRGSRVSLEIRPAPDGPLRLVGGWTTTDPILGYDGCWQVGVSVYGQGVIVLPVNSLTVHRRHSWR